MQSNAVRPMLPRGLPGDMKGQERLSWSQLWDLFLTLRRGSGDHPFLHRFAVKT